MAKLLRLLQIVSLLAVVALGAAIWRQATQNLLVGSSVLGIIALGFVGVGASAFAVGAAGETGRSGASSSGQQRSQPFPQRLAGELVHAVGGMRAALEAIARFSTSVRRSASQLPSLRGPEQVRAVVVSLIEENDRIREQIGELTHRLEESRARVARLETKLAAAKARAARDALTGLNNRRSFDHALERALESRSGRPVSLIAIDLDRFKSVNDRFGHAAGDDVLRAVGGVLSEAAAQEMTVARIGGEEFAIICEGRDRAFAVELAETIRARVEANAWPIKASGALAITASFGVAECRPTESAVAFLQRADRALYGAKSNGRNCVVAA